MDWSRIKSIFIIAFLILDLFLVSQLMTKTNKLEVKVDVTFEENLKNDAIVYDILPKDSIRDQYMSANTRIFSEEDVEGLKHQRIYIEDDTNIRSELENPIAISEKDNFPELHQFIKENVLEGKEYVFWNYDEKAGEITFYQKYNDKIMFMNRSAHLVFHVNELNEIDSYSQTMLETFEPMNDKEEVFTAMRAFEVLYNNGLLKPDSTVVRADFGYYTVVSMEATQVLTPTWHFVVEHDGERENLLVNAVEGQIIQVNASPDKTLME